MFEVIRSDAIAIVRDGGTGKIQGAAVEIANDFHGIRIGDVDRGRWSPSVCPPRLLDFP